VCGHNAARFDCRKANSRFIANGLKPPTPYKTVDTLKIARTSFKFDSNRLDDLGQYLGVGRKKPNTGKALWLGCMAGDPKCWKQMAAYNKQDVNLLEAVYLKLRAWHSTHPNLNHFTGAVGACPVCQSFATCSGGFNYTSTGKRHRIICKACGHNSVDGKRIKAARTREAAPDCPRCQSPDTSYSGFDQSTAGKRQNVLCNACGRRFLTGARIREAA
jgi:hypothetical protein